MKTIELEDDAAALIMTADGKLEVHIPVEFEGDMVPAPIQFMAALSILTGSDEEFFLYVMDKFNKMVEETESEEKE